MRATVDLTTQKLYTASMMSSDDPIINKLRAWSYRRQQLSQTASRPTEALRSVVAVYSSCLTASLSLLGRSKSLEAINLNKMEQPYRDRNSDLIPL